MQKKVTLDYLANKLNMSKTTVSKAINNCPGITSKTKSRVMQAVTEHGYAIKKPDQGVAVILPSVPGYFWGTVMKQLANCLKTDDTDCKFYVYNNLRDGADIMQGIKSAILQNACVLIIAAPDLPQIRTVLEECANKTFVILLEEFLEIKNAFFVGSNCFSESADLCRKYLENNPNSDKFAIVKATGYSTENLRINGFVSVLNKSNIQNISYIETGENFKTQAAHIARSLARFKELPHCIFCPSGNMAAVDLAIKKLHTQNTIHCIGFDFNLENGNGENMGYAIIQDTEKLCKTAAQLTRDFLQTSHFPQEKYNYIESIYYKK